MAKKKAAKKSNSSNSHLKKQVKLNPVKPLLVIKGDSTTSGHEQWIE